MDMKGAKRPMDKKDKKHVMKFVVSLVFVLGIAFVISNMNNDVQEHQEVSGNVASEVTPESQTSNRIRILKATWGANCRDKTGSNMFGVGLGGDGYKVQENNVLEKIKQLCDNKAACKFRVTRKNMGIDDPASGCTKNLEVQYRCFSYDKRRLKEVYEQKEFKITCVGM